MKLLNILITVIITGNQITYANNQASDSQIRDLMHNYKIEDRINNAFLSGAHAYLIEQLKKCSNCNIDINKRLASYNSFMPLHINYLELNKILFHSFKKYFTTDRIDLFTSYSNYPLVQQWQTIETEMPEFARDILNDLNSYYTGNHKLQEQFNVSVSHIGTSSVIETNIKSAKNNDISAIHELCFSYKYGKNIQIDTKKAIEWCTKGSELNIDSATVLLAEIYDGTNDLLETEKYQSKEKSKQMYMQAAKSGHEHAQYVLGAMMIKEGSSKETKKEGILWLKKSAKSGNSNALNLIKENNF